VRAAGTLSLTVIAAIAVIVTLTQVMLLNEVTYLEPHLPKGQGR